MENHVVAKFSSLVDEFVRIRIFEKKEVEELLRMREAPTRRAYQQLVITACVVDYNEVRKTETSEDQIADSERLEDHFFALSVEVNPRLALDQVTIPMDTEEKGADLHLLSAEPAGEETSPFENLAKIARNLESEIKKRVIGQEEAISSVAKSIQKAVIGLRDPARPIGTFLFVGQTGVGKTELAKALTTCLFEDTSKLVRIDCSEYSLPHEYAKLIGAPPGYIGFGEGGYLTDKTRNNEPCVVLFDEVEKAHSKVHNLLLQILDEGWLTDSKGDQISFKDALIILTSNVGVDKLQRYRNHMGFDTAIRKPPSSEVTREATLASLKEEFRPEFINRLDEVVVFNSLTRADCHKITGNLLEGITDRAKHSGLNLVFTRRARDFLVKEGFSHEYGARELKRTLRELVEDPLTDRVLNGSTGQGSRVCVDVKRRQIVFHNGRGKSTT